MILNAKQLITNWKTKVRSTNCNKETLRPFVKGIYINDGGIMEIRLKTGNSIKKIAYAFHMPHT